MTHSSGNTFDCQGRQITCEHSTRRVGRYDHDGSYTVLADTADTGVGFRPSDGLTSVPPVSFNGNTDWIRIAGRPYSGDHIEVNRRDVSADYFTTIGATLVDGRHFTDEEDAARRAWSS